MHPCTLHNTQQHFLSFIVNRHTTHNATATSILPTMVFYTRSKGKRLLVGFLVFLTASASAFLSHDAKCYSPSHHKCDMPPLYANNNNNNEEITNDVADAKRRSFWMGAFLLANAANVPPAQAAPPIAVIAEELGYFPVTNRQGETVMVPKRVTRSSSEQAIQLAQHLKKVKALAICL